jgi:hypothetical protein
VGIPACPQAFGQEGRFTAALPLCAHGTAVDVEDVVSDPLTVMRKYPCDDGSGTFAAFLLAIAAEHGGNGTWKIVAGADRYATLRGKGTYTRHLVSGNRDDFPSIVCQTTLARGRRFRCSGAIRNGEREREETPSPDTDLCRANRRRCPRTASRTASTSALGSDTSL